MDDIRKQLSRQEFHLMTYMWMEERPLTMKEICAWMGKEQEPANSSTTGAQLRELIQKNFVCKTGKEDRKQCIQLWYQERHIISGNCENFRNAGS